MMGEIGRIKLGSQGLEAEMIQLIHRAVENGITFLDTSDVYGPLTNEILLGKALNASLRRLNVDCIDLYYQHRVDTGIPIEVTMGELKKLVEEGKIKYIGLSEASSSTIKRAHAVHPITAVQLEWSLWSRDVEEDVIPTCRDLGIGIVAYSPVGRGFLSNLPRFQRENLEHNKRIFERVNQLALKKGCNQSHLALAWVHHQGSDVCPIPGTTKIKNRKLNIGALSLQLSLEEMAELEKLASENDVKGDRYGGGIFPTCKNSDTPELSSWKNSRATSVLED
ncbi:hypothetical protein ACHQM5_010257 [Ranunculus cassubicifolius]